jgi:hypothetical protein
VWETVFVPLNDERRSLESSARYQRDLEQAERRRARRGNTTRPVVRERTAIEERLARELGLQPSEIDALAKYAIDALDAEGRNASLVRQQVICNRSGLFETSEAYGRAFAEVAEITRSDRGRIVAGLDEIMGTEVSKKILSFALSTVGSTILTIDVEAGLSQLSRAELADWVGFLCKTG